MLEAPVLWALAGGGFVASVVASIAEGAIFYHSPAKLEEAMREPEVRERLAPHVPHLDRYLFSAKVVRFLSAAGLIVLSGAACAGTEEATPGGVLAAGALATLAVLLFAIVLPRALAEGYADRILPQVLSPVVLLERIFFPIVFPLHRLQEALRGAVVSPVTRERIADDILSAAHEGEREGVLNEEDASMIESIIEFREAEVREIMTPRTEMVGVEVHCDIRRAAALILECGHSRVPVFEQSRDHIVGLLYAKDILQVLLSSADGEQGSIRPLLREPMFVPETKPIGDLLKEFRSNKVHLAVVLDEWGGTAGIVTIEDVLEEIVGEIEDEYDDDERDPIERVDPVTAEVDAKLHVGELNKELGLRLREDDEYETVGGFVMFSLGKVPRKGESFAHDGARFTVLHADERRVNRVRVELVSTEEVA